ncbi:MAG: hypothetical protein KJS95_07940 [Gammaproteobacteria bacterium]|nr:hypothetical protein [Gammaproteobacteria bacterium]
MTVQVWRERLRPRDLAEVALPAFAGLAHGWRQLPAAPEVSALWPGISALVLCLLVLAVLSPRVKNMSLAALLLGAAPMFAAAFVMQPGVSTLRDPMLWCLAVPFAMWCGALRLVEAPGAEARSMFRLANTLPLIALAVPAVGGEVHWGIVILPFAVFRVASSTADMIRPGKEYAVSLAEAQDVARRIQWVGGAWVAGWAGVTP